MKQSKMKRKRRELCPSPILDEAPKRTKVHAQRKFAQGSNVNSPVITPVKEFERIDRSLDLTPEPVELLPIQRPNTEDFLTFLCFRGTPLLPPTLNFFNTASIVDTNGQVHEIKSESPKNGPIDTSVITKGGSGSSERPFIAFGVRKRADPIVISRQMERKRRHALALQALRRKYQEQKMAKIRAVTISKLSEKPSSRTPPVRSNSVIKIEKLQQAVPTKPAVQKNKVISTKHINITQSVNRTINSKMKPKMCLRSFRGRFVQQELPFRPIKKHKIPEKIIEKKSLKKQNKKETITSNKNESNSDKKKTNSPVKNKDERKIQDLAIRVTRSGKIPLKPKLKAKQIIKRRILLPNSTTLIKSRVLRSQTLKSSSNVQLRITRRCSDRKGPSVILEKLPRKLYKMKIDPFKESEVKFKSKDILKCAEMKEYRNTKIEKTASTESSKLDQDTAKPSKISKGSDRVLRNEGPAISQNTAENKLKSKDIKQVNIVKKEVEKTSQKTDKKDKKDVYKNKSSEDKQAEKPKILQVEIKREIEKKQLKKVNSLDKSIENKSEDSKPKEKKEIKQIQLEIVEQKEQKLSQRPSRKTKEAAAIYMEILSHKLVNDTKIDDDNVSIDSFPELPNVKRTEQRENELKAKANISKGGKSNKQNKIVKVDSEPIPPLEKGKEKIADKSETDSQSDSEPRKKLSKVPPARERGKKDFKSHEIDVPRSKLSKEKNNTKTDSIQKLEVDLPPKKCKSEPDVVKTRSMATTDSPKDEIHKHIKKEPQELGKKEIKSDVENIKNVSNIGAIAKNEKIKQEDIKPLKPECKLLEKKPIPKDKCVEKQETTAVEEEKLESENITSEDSSDSNECLANIPKKSSKIDGRKERTMKKITENIKKIADVKSQGSPNIKKPLKLLSDSDDECLANLGKYVDSKKDDSLSKRQTRYNNVRNKLAESNDSEDSFHVDVKIPRKKQLTRSRSSKMSVTSSRPKSVARLNACSDTEDSDESFQSKKTTKNVKRTNKKSPKKKDKNKVVDDFSDSDEEPLSKFTRNNKDEEKTAEKLKEDILRKQKALIESPPQKSKIKKSSKHKEVKETAKGDIIEDSAGKKPKRECAKRPSNYLPMFSSSDDEEKFFYGFSLKNEKKNESNFSHSSLDFLSKDLGRRFGKEKVNMSNEQIEKWLKDSAMAGNDNKKEEDLTFCQEIPTQTSQDISPSLDTEKLRKSLLETKAKTETTPEKKSTSSSMTSTKISIYKSPGDRKPIFKKAKSKTAPAVGAFSVNDESSIYAFEEELETTLNTPFRRPARRPSSTATSRSEDEFSKSEDQPKLSQFRKPILRNDEPKSKTKEVELSSRQISVSPSLKPVQKPGTSRNSLGKISKKPNTDQMDDFKYKVPSSPSASSSSSAKLYKKQSKYKTKPLENCNAIKVTDFPCNGPGELVEAPTFYPTEKEFQDPLEYIEKISKTAEQFGVCKIVPPSTFKPECKVSDDMRFTSYNQYVHKMLHRWGPNFKELMAIRKYLQTQNINLNQPPWIGGMEVDLPRLYQTVQNLGGLKEVIEKEKWSKVSDIMRIPKSAQDRVTKLDDIYCKYLLPYDTLSPDEREKLLDEVETEWAKRESKTLLKMQELDNVDPENESDSESDNEVEECITKGRNMALNAFYRIARNTMSMWFKNTEPTAQEIEQEFWKHVDLRQNHICVHSGSIDSGSWGYGFAVSKNSPFARHAWNLKVLTNNSGSVLRSLGPVMGVTVPTLHVGMVFSACCWYRDPHSLPWIEYLHTGGKKIWYGIPNSVSELFRKALTKLVPNYCKNQGIWLPSDTVMLPPSLLIESGVSLSRIVQEPGQFIVVFPKAFTSSISTGYVVSESVFFAPPSWLKTAQMTFDLLRKSCEPSMFSLDRLYLSIINDQRTSVDVLKQMIPIVSTISSREKTRRDTIKSLGVTNFEVLPPPEAPNTKRKKKSQDSGDYECEVCRTTLFISMIAEQEDAIYCLDHAIEQIEKKVILSENCKLLFTYSEEELAGLVAKINQSIEQKLQKKVFNKFSGMPTLLNK